MSDSAFYLGKVNTIKVSNQKLNISIAMLSFVLLGAAFFHRMQLHNVGLQYRESILIQVEGAALISLLILNFINSMCFFCHLFKKEWKKLFLVLGVSLGSFFIVVAAVIVDAPTLIYAT